MKRRRAPAAVKLERRKYWLAVAGFVLALLTAAATGWQHVRNKRQVTASIGVAPEYFLPEHRVANKVLRAANFAADVANTGNGDLYLDSVSIVVGTSSGAGVVIALRPEDGVFTLKERQKKSFGARVDAETIHSYRSSGYDDVVFVVRDGLGVLKELHHCERLLGDGVLGAFADDGHWIAANLELRP